MVRLLAHVSSLRSSAFLTGLAVVAGVLGCSRSGASIAPVAGRVVVDGKPAGAATVTLHPVNPGAEFKDVRPTGQTDADGRFALTTFAHNDGAPSGEYRVTVAWYQPAAKRGSDGDDLPPKPLLPAVYTNPTDTPLRATVKPGDPLTIEIKRR